MIRTLIITKKFRTLTQVILSQLFLYFAVVCQ